MNNIIVRLSNVGWCHMLILFFARHFIMPRARFYSCVKPISVVGTSVLRMAGLEAAIKEHWKGSDTESDGEMGDSDFFPATEWYAKELWSTIATYVDYRTTYCSCPELLRAIFWGGNDDTRAATLVFQGRAHAVLTKDDLPMAKAPLRTSNNRRHPMGRPGLAVQQLRATGLCFRRGRGSI
ncbi:hypothetical protein B0H11DRAFT_2402175 [Mycena galericulata]|nr:hypothetical protein B0H11DRAFT_2402175 [Mycena galericulata]